MIFDPTVKLKLTRDAVIELHASFLESNLLFQVRALPNPAYNASTLDRMQHAHPLTIHLSPTSTANVIVSTLTPPQPSTVPFAKIASDGEVIVAPKIRPSQMYRDRVANRSVASGSSMGARSKGAGRRRGQPEAAAPKAIFIRAVDQRVVPHLFDEDEIKNPFDEPLTVWADRDVFRHNGLKRSDLVSVSCVKPSGLQPSVDAQQVQKLATVEESGAGVPTKTVIARLLEWNDCPDTQHVALSPMLSCTLSIEAAVGEVVRLSPAPPRSSRSTVGGLKLYPFTSSSDSGNGLRITSQGHPSRQGVIERMRAAFDSKAQVLLHSFITDGQLLPPLSDADWDGGIIRFKSMSSDSDHASEHPRWCTGAELKNDISVQQEIPSPISVDEFSSLQ